jgi:hypothetical protein
MFVFNVGSDSLLLFRHSGVLMQLDFYFQLKGLLKGFCDPCGRSRDLRQGQLQIGVAIEVLQLRDRVH